MRKRETIEPRNTGLLLFEKVDVMKWTANSIYAFEMARMYKLFRGLRVWRVCNDMVLELERDYTIFKDKVCVRSIKSTNTKVV